jgi:hypothetical protein
MSLTKGNASVVESFMGASGWYHFVPYEPDVAVALHKLREEVFRTGNYYHRVGRKPETLAQLEQAAGPDGTHSVIDVCRVIEGTLPEPFLTWLKRELQAGSQPLDDERARRMQIECAARGGVGRLSDRALHRVFGTTRPNRSAAERALFAISGIVPRGCGAVVEIYDADRPSEFLFVGKTGD